MTDDEDVFDPATGEVATGRVKELILELQALRKGAQHEIDGLNRDLSAWRFRYAELKADKEEAAKNDPLYPKAEAVFDYWREKCKHPRSKFSRDRFEEVRPFLKAHGEKMCRKAIDGAAYDPFITDRKNGTKKIHNGWSLIFGKGRDKTEEFCCKAPITNQQTALDATGESE